MKPEMKPPWRVVIKGDKAEIEEMAATLRLGPVRVHTPEGIGFAYLEADELNLVSDYNQVFQRSKAILKQILGLRNLLGLAGEGAKPTAVDSIDEQGRLLRRKLIAEIPIEILAGADGELAQRLDIPTPSETWLAVAKKDSRVGAVIEDLGGPIDFPRLRRVFEHLWTEFDDEDETRALKKMAELGLVKIEEAMRFRSTVNRAAEGAHSPFKYKRFDSPLSVYEAKRWLFSVINKWIEQKAQPVQCGNPSPTLRH